MSRGKSTTMFMSCGGGSESSQDMNMVVEAKVDYSKPINLSLTAIVLIVGISGAAVNIGQVQLKGMALATVLAVYSTDVSGLCDGKRSKEVSEK